MGHLFEMKDLSSLPIVGIREWVFKVSVLDGVIMIVALNVVFLYTTVKFFDDEDSARIWVEELCGLIENED